MYQPQLFPLINLKIKKTNKKNNNYTSCEARALGDK
jgi:hypothetical protein